MRYLLTCHPCEVLELHDARLALIELAELVERILKIQDIDWRRTLVRGFMMLEVNAGSTASTLLAPSRPGVVHKNSAHHGGGDAEEMCTVLPRHISFADEPYEGLVGEDCRLERMPGALPGHRTLGD
jgi:hypothetical protein